MLFLDLAVGVGSYWSIFSIGSMAWHIAPAPAVIGIGLGVATTPQFVNPMLTSGFISWVMKISGIIICISGAITYLP